MEKVLLGIHATNFQSKITFKKVLLNDCITNAHTPYPNQAKQTPIEPLVITAIKETFAKVRKSEAMSIRVRCTNINEFKIIFTPIPLVTATSSGSP